MAWLAVEDLSSHLAGKVAHPIACVEETFFSPSEKAWVPRRLVKKLKPKEQKDLIFTKSVAQRAVSGLSRCRRCGGTLPKGSLRVGYPASDPRGPYELLCMWMHLQCARELFSQLLESDLGEKQLEALLRQAQVCLKSEGETEGLKEVEAPEPSVGVPKEEGNFKPEASCSSTASDATKKTKTVEAALSCAFLKSESRGSGEGHERQGGAVPWKPLYELLKTHCAIRELCFFEDEALSEEEKSLVAESLAGGLMLLLSPKSLAEENAAAASARLSSLTRREVKGRMESPPGLLQPLLRFQEEGLWWLVQQEQSEVRGGILADEMGMGKTIQIIALLLARPLPSLRLPDSGSAGRVHPAVCKTLVVTPLAALLQWRSELEKFVEKGRLKVLVYYGALRGALRETLHEYDVVLTTYQTVEYDFRRQADKQKRTCRTAQYCGRRFLPEKLAFHQQYFCGPTAQRTLKQRLTERKREEGTAKAMRTLQIIDSDAKDGAEKKAKDANKDFVPTPLNCLREILNQTTLSEAQRHELQRACPWLGPLAHRRQRLESADEDCGEETLPSSDRKRKQSSEGASQQASPGVQTLKRLKVSELRALYALLRSERRDAAEGENDVEASRLSRAQLLERLASAPSSVGDEAEKAKGEDDLREESCSSHSLRRSAFPKAKKKKGAKEAVGSQAASSNGKDELRKIPSKKKGAERAKKEPEKAKKEPEKAKKEPEKAKKEPEKAKKEPEKAKVKTETRRPLRVLPKREEKAKKAGPLDASEEDVYESSESSFSPSSSAPSSSASSSLYESSASEEGEGGSATSSDLDDSALSSSEEQHQGRSARHRRGGRPGRGRGGDSRITASISNANGTAASVEALGYWRSLFGLGQDADKDGSSDAEGEAARELLEEQGVLDEALLESPLHSVVWQRLVLDEAHRIKARTSSTAQAVFALKTATVNARAKDAPPSSEDSASREGFFSSPKTASTEAALKEPDDDPTEAETKQPSKKRASKKASGKKGSAKKPSAKAEVAVASAGRKEPLLLIGGSRWCLTGTPLQNRVGELYSLIRVLRFYPYAYYFCSRKDCSCRSMHFRFVDNRYCVKCNHARASHYSFFNRRVVKPIKDYGFQGEGVVALETLKKEVLDVVLLRRTKTERAEDVRLPPLSIRIRRDELSAEERDFYGALFKQTATQFDSYVHSGTVLHNFAHIFDLLARLRQAVDHPYLLIHGSLCAKSEGIEMPTPSRNVLQSGVCVVCLEDLPEGPSLAKAQPAKSRRVSQTAVYAKCGHGFHRVCLDEFIESAPTAPEKEISDSKSATLGCPSCFAPLTVELNDEDEDGEGSAFCGHSRTEKEKEKVVQKTRKTNLGGEESENELAEEESADGALDSHIAESPETLEAQSAKSAPAEGEEKSEEKEPTEKSQVRQKKFPVPSRAKKGIMSRISAAAFTSSTKIEALIQEIKATREKDPSAKSLVFSQFCAMLDLIEFRLKQEGIFCAQLNGSMTAVSRSGVLYAFDKDPSLSVILISLKAGGEGLNLQVASRVYLVDPWWNPAAELQAIQRAHRIGQKKAVEAVRFICKDTIEERILQLQEKKQLVFDGTVGSSNQAITKLTQEDLRFLFQS